MDERKESLTLLAENGDAEAQHKVESLTQAAEQGNVEAQYNLGLEYYYQMLQYCNTEFATEKARYWLAEAGERGHEEAINLLFKRSFQFWKEPEHKEKERYWHDKGVEILTRRNIASSSESSGCYVATCVYGSYDCPEVWTFRQFRDNTLKNSWLGRQFISIYYATSPKAVELFGENNLFRKACKSILDKILVRLTREK